MWVNKAGGGDESKTFDRLDPLRALQVGGLSGREESHRMSGIDLL